MNRLDPNGSIGWAQYSWNPLTGCLHGCPYCYARDLAKRFHEAFPKGFEPTEHRERLGEPARLKKPSTIFACSMSDFWGHWWSDVTRCHVCEAMIAAPQHIYVVLTKAPWNAEATLDDEEPWTIIADLWMDAPVIAGVSLTGLESPEHRAQMVRGLGLMGHGSLVSCEPLLARIDPCELPKWAEFSWLIIGGCSRTRTHAAFTPPHEWIEELREWASARGVAIYIKKNAGYPEIVREWPEGVPHEEARP